MIQSMNHLKNRLVDLLSVFKAREVVLLVSASSFNNSHESFPGQASWQYLSGSPPARFRRCSPRGTLREGRWSTVFSNTEDSLLLRNTLIMILLRGMDTGWVNTGSEGFCGAIQEMNSIYRPRSVPPINSPMEFKRWMNMRSEFSGVHWPH